MTIAGENLPGEFNLRTSNSARSRTTAQAQSSVIMICPGIDENRPLSKNPTLVPRQLMFASKICVSFEGQTAQSRRSCPATPTVFVSRWLGGWGKLGSIPETAARVSFKVSTRIYIHDTLFRSTTPQRELLELLLYVDCNYAGPIGSSTQAQNVGGFRLKQACGMVNSAVGRW